jgi:hypothetical protein
LPADIGRPVVAPEVSAATFHKYDPEVPAAISRYALTQFVAITLGAVVVLRLAHQLTWFQVGVLVFYFTVSLSNLGGLLERRRWVYSMELARLATLLAVSGVLLAVPRFDPLPVAIVGLFGVVSLAWFARLRTVVRPGFQTA